MSLLADIDLNLLLAFDALLAERSVTRAADRLGLSQPATSNALARLRRSFNDPLLVRGRGGMVPTPRALALAGPVRDALATLEEALESLGRFEPRRARRSFRVAMGEAAQLLLLPALIALLAEEAPEVSVAVHPLGPGLRELLERGRVDLAVGAFAGPPPGHQLAELLREPMVGLARAGHPALEGPLDVEAWAGLRHLRVAPVGAGPGVVDRLLVERGLERRVAVRAPSALAAAALLERSDLVMTEGARVAEALSAGRPLRSFPLPLSLPPRSLGALWHARHSHDPAQCWLRGAAARALGLAVPAGCGASSDAPLRIAKETS